MALTMRALAYLAIAYSFLLLSLALQTLWLSIFAIPIAFLLFSSSKPPRSQPNPISVTRELRPTRSVSGENVNVTLVVTNTTSRKIRSVLIEDVLPPGLKISAGVNRPILTLESNHTASFQYQISAPKRGGYRIGPVRVRFTDNLGFRLAVVEIQCLDELIVLPTIEKLGTVDLKGRRFGPWPGFVPSKRIGEGTEFFELAPYIAGVDLRRVNWKASARSGILVTNEFEGEQVIDVLVVLDCVEEESSQLFDYDALEFEVSFAASLCSQLIKQGNRVGLAVYGSVRTWVNPGFGRHHLLHLLDSLAVVRPGRATLPIQYVVESVVTSVLPARALVVLISPMLGEEVVDVIEAIAGKGYSIATFVPNLKTKFEGASESSQLAWRILRLERKLRILRARKMSYVAQLSPDVSITPLLRMRSK